MRQVPVPPPIGNRYVQHMTTRSLSMTSTITVGYMPARSVLHLARTCRAGRGLQEEPAGSRKVTPVGQHDVDDLAVLVNSPAQVHPAARHPNADLIDEPPIPATMTTPAAASTSIGVRVRTYR